jgi:hypothetical protein
MVIGLIVCGVAVWGAQAFGLSQLMNRRGFHPRLWFVVPLVIGPACWPLALLRALPGPPVPEVVRGARRRTGPLEVFEVFVVLERDEIPAQVLAQVTRLMPYCHRLVFARVIKAGGPTDIKKAAEGFLHRIARHLGSDDVELQIMFGDMQRAVRMIHRESVFNIVLRSDQPDELFDGDGGMQRMLSLSDVMSA